MSEPAQVPTTRGNPSVDFVVLQHFASMVDELGPRATRAEEVARVTQHQVNVLSRHVRDLTDDLDWANVRIAHMDAFITASTTFTQGVIAGIPDIDNDDQRVIEFNRMINEYNRNNPIDLTTDEELD